MCLEQRCPCHTTNWKPIRKLCFLQIVIDLTVKIFVVIKQVNDGNGLFMSVCLDYMVKGIVVDEKAEYNLCLFTKFFNGQKTILLEFDNYV